MKRQSGQWFGNIAAFSLFVLVLTGSGFAGTYDDGKTAGTLTAQTAISRFGSQDTSNLNISQPMTSPTKWLNEFPGEHHGTGIGEVPGGFHPAGGDRRHPEGHHQPGPQHRWHVRQRLHAPQAGFRYLRQRLHLLQPGDMDQLPVLQMVGRR
jgi:hypothetical protein